MRGSSASAGNLLFGTRKASKFIAAPPKDAYRTFPLDWKVKDFQTKTTMTAGREDSRIVPLMKALLEVKMEHQFTNIEHRQVYDLYRGKRGLVLDMIKPDGTFYGYSEFPEQTNPKAPGRLHVSWVTDKTFEPFLTESLILSLSDHADQAGLRKQIREANSKTKMDLLHQLVSVQ